VALKNEDFTNAAAALIMELVNARILLVDDHRILRDGLRALLQSTGRFSVVGEAGDVAGALTLTRKLSPDAVILDVTLPDGTGVEACRQIASESPAARVLMLSASLEPRQLTGALKAGARGYLLKDHALEELVRALDILLGGQFYLCPEAATTLVEEHLAQAGLPPQTAKPALSAREIQVLKLITEGMRNKEMADVLNVSTKSVETYRARLMSKLGCDGVAELVRYAIREGIAKM